MFCHRCGTEMPEDSLYCRNCGARLITDHETGDLAANLTSQDVYFLRLAEALGQDGFRTDARLLDRSHAVDSLKVTLKAMKIFTTQFMGPLAEIFGPLAEPVLNLVTRLEAIDGQMVYEKLDSIAPQYTLTAAKYAEGRLILLGVVEADTYSNAQLKAKAQTLLEAAHQLGHPGLMASDQPWLRRLAGVRVDSYCLYVFFDPNQAATKTKWVLKNTRLYKRPTPLHQVQALVWPIAIDVSRQEIIQKGLTARLMSALRLMPVSEEALRRTLRGG